GEVAVVRRPARDCGGAERRQAGSGESIGERACVARGLARHLDPGDAGSDQDRRRLLERPRAEDPLTRADHARYGSSSTFIEPSRCDTSSASAASASPNRCVTMRSKGSRSRFRAISSIAGAYEVAFSQPTPITETFLVQMSAAGLT